MEKDIIKFTSAILIATLIYKILIKLKRDLDNKEDNCVYCGKPLDVWDRGKLIKNCSACGREQPKNKRIRK